MPGAALFGLRRGTLDPETLQLLGTDIRLIDGDVTDPAALEAAFRTSHPDVVIHLAASSSVARSWSNAARALQINAIGTANLFEIVRNLPERPVVVVASSSEIYGAVAPGEGPINEDRPLAPVSPYGTSKAVQDLLAAQYFTGHGVPTVRLRPFHLTGPRRPAHFVASSFAEQIARIEFGMSPPRLHVGNLDAVRDLTDVRDAARAYSLAATRAEPGSVFNLCSGHPVRIGDLLDDLLGLSQARIEVSVDPDRLRASDIPWLVGDHSRLTEATGWQPVIPLRQTLSDLLDWWRGQIEGQT
jgi:GDP-4-dehydro-6-deoxy-D-mannose reductase